MKKICIFILMSLFSNSIYSKNNLEQHWEKIYEKAINLQSIDIKDKVYKDKVNEFYDNFFLNGKNMFKLVDDNWESKYNCGILSLKKSCFTEVFKTDVLINDKTACINSYGVNKQDESMVLQSTTLFIKNDKDWRIVGSRLAQSNVIMLVYGLLNDEEPSNSYTNRCFDYEKYKNWNKNKMFNLSGDYFENN